MCRSAICRSCGLTTWTGCGQHVADVMRDVAVDSRCRCSPASASAGSRLSRILHRAQA